MCVLPVSPEVTADLICRAFLRSSCYNRQPRGTDTRPFNLGGGALPSEGFHKTDFKCLFEVRQLVLFMMMNMFSPQSLERGNKCVDKSHIFFGDIKCWSSFSNLQTVSRMVFFFKEYGGEGLVFLVHTTTQRSTGC